MQRFRLTLLLPAALLIGAAFSSAARAEAGLPDFDQGRIDARGAVAEAREAAGASREAIPGTASDRALAAAGPVQRRIVSFREGTPRARKFQIMSGVKGRVTKDLRLINAVAVEIPKSQLRSFESGLRAFAEIKRVEEDYEQNWLLGAPAARPLPAAALPRPGAFAPKDEAPPAGQEVPWGIARVNAKEAWAKTRGEGIKVAVVDTGIDFDHTDLAVIGGYNTIDPNVSFKDDNGHGTHVAGTIAAQDDDKGVVGVAPAVALYGVKVLSGSGSGTFADVIEGIQWTVENHMDIANFSLGASRGTEALAEAVKAARDAGTAIIAAAGNSGGAVGFPAAYPEVIAVAASDSQDRVAYFSSRGPEVDIITPGVAVQSTYMGGGYSSLSGTSMACPHAVGLASLAAAATGARGTEALRSALKAAATPFPGVPETEQGAGLPDAAKLVSP